MGDARGMAAGLIGDGRELLGGMAAGLIGDARGLMPGGLINDYRATAGDARGMAYGLMRDVSGGVGGMMDDARGLASLPALPRNFEGPSSIWSQDTNDLQELKALTM